MKARTPFWPLLRNELGWAHCPAVAWALGLGSFLTLWGLASSFPLLLLFLTAEGNLATFFTAFGDLAGFALVWWLAMHAWFFAFATVPGISNPLQSVRAFDFMFTRPLDRRLLFRARVLVIVLVMFGPLLISLLVAACRPEVRFVPDTSDASLPRAAARLAEYTRAFPNSHSAAGQNAGTASGMVVPDGAPVLIAWILWLGALAMVFMKGYCVLLARHVQHHAWLAGLTVSAPVLVAFVLTPRISRIYPGLFEENFLFFARNLVPLSVGLLALALVVQVFAERRFSRLEIL